MVEASPDRTLNGQEGQDPYVYAFSQTFPEFKFFIFFLPRHTKPQG